MKPPLTIADIIHEAEIFCDIESHRSIDALFGITDGKAVGTYIEQSFQNFLSETYQYRRGSSASGVDLPDEAINTDIKVTSIMQPQSSCPFRNARQKIYGLGYNLLVFVYDKRDALITKTTQLEFIHCAFIEKSRTADYQTTFFLRQLIAGGANIEEIAAYLYDRNLPADDAGIQILAEEIVTNPPEQGYITISNALQWRLQYSRIVNLQDTVHGVIQIKRGNTL
jgi:hypothetical protein